MGGQFHAVVAPGLYIIPCGCLPDFFTVACFLRDLTRVTCVCGCNRLLLYGGSSSLASAGGRLLRFGIDAELSWPREFKK
jgi:hypothetical protein